MTSKTELLGSGKLGLTEGELSTYQRDGVLLIRKAFDECEVRELGDEADRILVTQEHLLNENNLRTRYTPHHETGLPVFEKFDPFVDLSSVARRIVQDERILQPLSAIYGEPACLFKDKLIYKPPGATGATLHQDWISWPGFPESFITVLVAIDPFTATSGATEFYLGEHKRGYLSPRDTQHHVLKASQFEVRPKPLEMEPGDMAIFSCFVPHGSAPNLSSSHRRGYFISYNALSDGGDQYHSHYAEFHQWIRARFSEPRRSELYFA
jgi:2-aminoethylphosphonate dioxygenase